jgi:hypothetical protein
MGKWGGEIEEEFFVNADAATHRVGQVFNEREGVGEEEKRTRENE